MRKLVNPIMALLFLAAVISGAAEAHAHPGQAGHHAILAGVFALFVIVHIAFHFKAILRSFKGSGKKSAS